MEKPFCESSSDSEMSSSEESGNHEASETQLVHDKKVIGLWPLIFSNYINILTSSQSPSWTGETTQV